MAVFDTLYPSQSVCHRAWAFNDFFTTVSRAVVERLFLTLARMLDVDARSQSVTIKTVCTYGRQNKTEFAYLFSPDGIRAYPKGNAEIDALCDTWEAFIDTHPLRTRIQVMRDKTLAHRDKSFVMGRVQIEPTTRTELLDLVNSIGQFVNEVNRLVVGEELVPMVRYAQVHLATSNTVALCEAMLALCSENRDEQLWKTLVEPHKAAIQAAFKAMTTES
jgi:hypothetical protein